MALRITFAYEEKTMTHGFTKTSLFLKEVTRLGWCAGLIALAVSTASAQPRCSVLEGSYAFTSQGTIPVPGSTTSATVPFGVVGIATFDAAGTFSQVESGFFPGTVLRSVRMAGTYVLNPNCTGTATLRFPDGTSSTVDFVVSNQGKTLYGVGVDAAPPGASLFLTFTKLTPNP